VLGSMLLSQRAVDEMIGLLEPCMFYRDPNARIFEAIVELRNKQVPIDLMTVSDKLKARGDFERCGGGEYLTTLMAAVPTAHNARQYAESVRNTYDLRRLIGLGDELKSLAYARGSASEIALAVQEKLFAMAAQPDREPKGFRDAVRPLLAEIAERANKPLAIPTGLTGIDNLTGGITKGEFVIVGARPSVGKTALATSIARNVAFRGGVKVLMFSLEMTVESILEGLLCAEAGLQHSRIRQGGASLMELNTLQDAVTPLYDSASLWIDDSPALTIGQIEAKARRHAMRHGVDVVIVDYLQRIRRSRSQQSLEGREFVTELSHRLKTMASLMRVPVVALSQLRRPGSDNPKPMIEQLMESGYIEADADAIWLLWREHYQDRDWHSAWPDPTELHVAKNRNGPTGVVRLMFEATQRRFRDARPDEWTGGD
jgi:replicative DNA helicase